jgi:hypothetical protein
MLWEIIHKTGFHQNLEPERILVFERAETGGDGSGTRTAFLSGLLVEQARRPEMTLALTLQARDLDSERHPFTLPHSTVAFVDVKPGTYFDQLLALNQRGVSGEPETWGILLTPFGPPGVRGASAVDLLKGVLVLKRVLELNPSLRLSVREFRPGIQIVLPSQSDLRERFHLVDRDIAQLFYEVIHYYPEFEAAFNRRSRGVRETLISAPASSPAPMIPTAGPSRIDVEDSWVQREGERISAPARTDLDPAPESGYGWVIASSVNESAAEMEVAQLREAGVVAEVRPASVGGRVWYRIVVGRYASAEEAYRAKDRDVPVERVRGAWLVVPEASR